MTLPTLEPGYRSPLSLATADVAEWCADRPHAPSNYRVDAAYRAFKGEILQQLTDAVFDGISFVITREDPYMDTRSMFSHCDQNKLLIYGKCDLPFGHPLAEPLPSGLLTGPVDLMTFNTAFRAVHDWYGHYCPRNLLNEKGEAKAWLAHRAMFPRGIARLALVNETIAQSSLFFRNRREGRSVSRSYARQHANIWTGSERDLAKAVKAAVA